MFALLTAVAAVTKSFAREQTVLLPYNADVAALLSDAAHHERTYEDIAGVERHEFLGDHDGWSWRVVLAVPVAPQAARHR